MFPFNRNPGHSNLPYPEDHEEFLTKQQGLDSFIENKREVQLSPFDDMDTVSTHRKEKLCVYSPVIKVIFSYIWTSLRSVHRQ